MKNCYHNACDNLTMVKETNLKFLNTVTEVLAMTTLQIGVGYCEGNWVKIFENYFKISILILDLNNFIVNEVNLNFSKPNVILDSFNRLTKLPDFKIQKFNASSSYSNASLVLFIIILSYVTAWLKYLNYL